MKRTIIIAGAAVALLAACGSSGGAASTPAASTSSTAPAPSSSSPEPTSSSAQPSEEPSTQTIGSIEEAIERTGCTGYEVADEAAPFATEYGTCRWNGDRLQLYSFASEKDREKFLDLSADYGVTRGQVVICGLVVAALDKQKNTKKLRALLGGEPV